jgi:hypothetical protein
VTLAESKGGTAVAWREDFRVKIPGTGWLHEGCLRRFVQRCADGLARRAARLDGDPAAAGR